MFKFDITLNIKPLPSLYLVPRWNVTFRITDMEGLTAVENVTFTVTNVNEPPIAVTVRD